MSHPSGVSGDTLVNLADGRRVPIRDLAGASHALWTVSPEGKVRSSCLRASRHLGPAPAFKVTFASGRAIRVAPEQLLFGSTGWISARDVDAGCLLALARCIPAPPNEKRWNPHELVLLGQLVGDGSYLRGAPLRYTTASEENSGAVRESAESMGSTVRRYAGRGLWHQLLISGNGNRWHAHGVGRWLKELGIHGQRKHEKRLPVELFELPNEQVALVLRHLWATDGFITPRKPGGRGDHDVHYATCSPGLASDVAALLLRFGIVARLARTVKRSYRPCYYATIRGATYQRAFLDSVGAFGPRRGPAARLRILIDAGVAPVERRVDGGLAKWTRSDLFWDRVTAVEDESHQEMFTLSVLGDESWLADGIVCRGAQLPAAASAGT